MIDGFRYSFLEKSDGSIFVGSVYLTILAILLWFISYLLYKKGWNGINLDISKLSIELFNKARKDDLNINIAVSNTSKKVKTYFRKKIKGSKFMGCSSFN